MAFTFPSKPDAPARDRPSASKPDALARDCPSASNPEAPARDWSVPSASRGRSAFTLVELLVVIGIIAILAALVTPAVMRAQAAARNAAIKAEIDMLHMAIMNYKNEYGSFPPCDDSTLAAKHLARLFPRIPAGNISAELAAMTYAPPSGTSNLSPQTALRFWLTGYGSNPISPVQGGVRKKLYDFDQSRFPNSSLEYYFPNSQSVDAATRSYVYFDANSTNGYASMPAGSVAYRMDFNNNPPSQSTSYAFFNPDTFQIICSGRDGTFFTDDDLSNMWPSTWGDWKQSHKQ
jgi:prepilin-type N-terminal cleavage/methylation domain-containing protein